MYNSACDYKMLAQEFARIGSRVSNMLVEEPMGITRRTVELLTGRQMNRVLVYSGSFVRIH